MSWPATFEVSFVAPDGVSGPGELEVSPDFIRCIPGFFLGRERVGRGWRHTEREVDLYVARLAPPWPRVALSLHDGPEHFAVSTWRSAGGRLVGSLAAAGYSVTEHRAWLARGPRRR